MERHRATDRQGGRATRGFAMLLFPGFPMMAFSSVVEPLRAANALGAEPNYSWITVSATDKPITASNGITFTPDFRLTERPPADFIVVCSGGDADQLTAQAPIKWIRANLRRGAHLGSVADGAFYLARAGLLDDYACTLHWRSQPAFVEAFPAHRSQAQRLCHRPDALHLGRRRRRLRHDARHHPAPSWGRDGARRRRVVRA